MIRAVYQVTDKTQYMLAIITDTIYVTMIIESSSLLNWLAIWHIFKLLVHVDGICVPLSYSCMKSYRVS